MSDKILLRKRDYIYRELRELILINLNPGLTS